MTGKRQLILVSQDEGLIAHWQRVFGKSRSRVANGLNDLSKRQRDADAILWVDDSLSSPPDWRSEEWQSLLSIPHVRVVAASSNPGDDKAIEALDAGCAGYCHAYADAATLRQVEQVIEAGQVWIGKNLMGRLLHGTSRIAGAARGEIQDWGMTLSQREREVAILAANGASNQAIAADCGISERTVKAHLTSVFSKLNITDRLQLALRVHGIS
ncbi:MAG: response regulator transcription factor [Burkholderiales bacterium]|nr:response regulator transcription factor [Burkholderiales bacterium]